MVYLFVRLKLSNQFKFDDPLFQMPMGFLEREREREREKKNLKKSICLEIFKPKKNLTTRYTCASL